MLENAITNLGCLTYLLIMVADDQALPIKLDKKFFLMLLLSKK